MKSLVRIIFAAVLLSLISLTPALAAGQNTAVAEVAGQPLGETAASSPDAAAPVSQTAPSNTTAYTLDELGMTVNIPNNLYVFTRNTAQDDPKFTALNLKSEWLFGFFAAHDIYLNAVADGTYEIIITMTNERQDQNISDFNLLSDTELKTFIDNSAALYQVAGALQEEGRTAHYTGSEIFSENKQAKFIKSEFTLTAKDGNETYGVQYYTIHNGKAINIIMGSYSQYVIPECKSIMNDLIRNVAFTNSITPPERTDAQLKYINSLPLPLLIAINLGATFILFSLPMLVYRFIILRRPLDVKTAKKVAVIDGLAYVLLLTIYILYSGNYYIAAGILWSFLNYFILKFPKLRKIRLKETKPRPAKENVQAVIPSISNTSDNKTCKTCKKCYAVNLATSKTCFYCGEAMDDNEKEE